MIKKLLVIADLGHLKTFRLEQDTNFSHPRLRLIDDFQTNIPNHLREEVTDQAGRYRKMSVSANTAYMSDGEEHNLELERRRRATKSVANHIREILRREQGDGWYFAAPREVNKSILDELDTETRSRIEKNVPADLTRLNPEEVIRHFSA